MNYAESKLVLFEKDLDRSGIGIAPNNAQYRIINNGANFHVERSFMHGSELIVGFNGNIFETLTQARAWAITDGRHKLTSAFNSLPLSHREVII